MRAELGCAHARWAQVPSCEVGLAAHTRAELMSPHLIGTVYIDETWTGNGHTLLPSDAYDSAVAQFWAAYFDDEIVPVMRELRSAQGEDNVAMIERLKEGMGGFWRRRLSNGAKERLILEEIKLGSLI
ncbi:hypothetical protein AgCh_032030 [Apium graveolens]